ncbi:MAG: BMC domain-containing protein [Elusimicrobia bacterium]|nr:BMC domain-containing protein [Elusimicrobiota bacterium]
MTALGMIETMGLTAMVEAADVMLKTAKVQIAGYRKTGDGIVTVLVRGSVADCQAAVDAACSAANRVGKVMSAHVIPYPFRDLEELLPIRPVK